MTNKKHNFWVLLRLLVKEKGTRILGCPQPTLPSSSVPRGERRDWCLGILQGSP
jgi:hypothetical protein